MPTPSGTGSAPASYLPQLAGGRIAQNFRGT